MTFDLRLSRERQPDPAGTIGYDDDLHMIVLAWRNGNRQLALKLADDNRRASRIATQPRKDTP